MTAEFKLEGIESHMRYFWQGTAVSINQRNMLSPRIINGKRTKVITKSPKYRRFCDDLDQTFSDQWYELYEGRSYKTHVVLFVKFGRGNHRGHHLDVDAVIKPMQDALEKAGAIKNDKLVLAPIFAPMYPLKTPEDTIEVVVLELGAEWNFTARIIPGTA